MVQIPLVAGVAPPAIVTVRVLLVLNTQVPAGQMSMVAAERAAVTPVALLVGGVMVAVKVIVVSPWKPTPPLFWLVPHAPVPAVSLIVIVWAGTSAPGKAFPRAVGPVDSWRLGLDVPGAAESGPVTSGLVNVAVAKDSGTGIFVPLEMLMHTPAVPETLVTVHPVWKTIGSTAGLTVRALIWYRAVKRRPDEPLGIVGPVTDSTTAICIVSRVS